MNKMSKRIIFIAYRFGEKDQKERYRFISVYIGFMKELVYVRPWACLSGDKYGRERSQKVGCKIRRFCLKNCDYSRPHICPNHFGIWSKYGLERVQKVGYKFRKLCFKNCDCSRPTWDQKTPQSLWNMVRIWSGTVSKSRVQHPKSLF